MRAFSALLALSVIACASDRDHFFQPNKVRVLILSGRNNHDWRTTTPAIRRILDGTGRFDTRVSEEPAALSEAAPAVGGPPLPPCPPPIAEGERVARRSVTAGPIPMK